MLSNIINDYKKEILVTLDIISDNEKIKNLCDSLNNPNDFIKLDVMDLINLLEKNNYQDYTLAQVRTTIVYIQRNNLYDDKSFKEVIDEIVAFLQSKINNQLISKEECESLLKRIDNILKDLENERFLNDFDLIIKILKDKKYKKDDIFKVMQEIYENNARIFKKFKGANSDKFQEEEISITDSKSKETVLPLLNKYGYQTTFTPFETSLLENIDLEQLKAKLDFFEIAPEYHFLKDGKDKKLSLENHRLLVILLLAPLNNLSTIYQIAMKEKIEIEKISAMFYIDSEFSKRLQELINLNNNSKNEKERKAYSMLTTNVYESFLSVIKLFKELGYIGISKDESIIASLLSKDLTVFTSQAMDLEDSLRTFSEYGIMVRKPTVLTIKNPKSLLDSFVEIGLLDYARKYQGILLTKDEAFFHRIYYAKKNNLPIFRGTKFLASNITSVTGYEIDADNYKEKVPTYRQPMFEEPFFKEIIRQAEQCKTFKILNNDLIKVLDEGFKIDDETYLMIRQRISRLKVIRLLQIFLNNNSNDINAYIGLFFAIFHNTLLDKDTYDEIVVKVMRLYYLHRMVNENELYEITLKLGISREKVDELIGPSKGGTK